MASENNIKNITVTVHFDSKKFLDEIRSIQKEIDGIQARIEEAVSACIKVEEKEKYLCPFCGSREIGCCRGLY